MTRVAFVMEQHLGHMTYYENLRRFIEPSPQIETDWIKVTYTQAGSFWARLPFLPAKLRGSLIGRQQVRAGLSNKGYQAALFNTQVPAALGGSVIHQQPYVLCTDITPIQYDLMGTHYGHQADQQGLFQRYKHRVNTNLFQRAAMVLPWSNWTKASLIEDYRVDPQRIQVVPPGVDIDTWHPGKAQSSGPIRILFVGGDFYRKGGNLLMEVCEELIASQQIPQGAIELVLVTRSYIPGREWVTIHNNIQPNSAEILSIYQSCDIFVLPTRAEAFGIAAVEASASGLPVIATRSGGLTDIVVEGKTGFLISPDNKIELADRLLTLIRNSELRNQIGEAARDRAIKNFNARENASRVIDILCHVVQEKVEHPHVKKDRTPKLS